jgi:flagellar protein FliO/FliZ
MELIDSMSNPVKFIIVFVLILAVLAPLLWRRFNAGPGFSPRGRHPRLAVVETAAVDVRHRLVLVKRDNMEHLLLIGGPTNIVVESNIVRTAGPAALPRPIPDARAEAVRQPASPATEAPDWSLPMEQPVARPVRTVDLDAALQEPPARTAREAMADSMRAVRSSAAARRNPAELDNAPEEVAAPALMPGDVGHRAPPISPDPRRGAPAPEPPQVQRSQSPPEPPPPPANDGPAEPRPRERVIPAAQRPAPPMVPAASAQPAPPRQVQPAPPTVPAVNAPRPVQHMPAAPPPVRPAPSSDQGNFAEMAQRLEAALRRPNPAKADPSGRPAGRAEPTMGRKPVAPEAGPVPKVNVRAPEVPPDLKVPSGKGKNESAMDSLEDEMAKMLGRPGKS